VIGRGADDHGVGGLVTAVQVEEGQELLCERVPERVDVLAGLDVVEGHLALLAVHVHAHAIGPGVKSSQVSFIYRAHLQQPKADQSASQIKQ